LSTFFGGLGVERFLHNDTKPTNSPTPEPTATSTPEPTPTEVRQTIEQHVEDFIFKSHFTEAEKAAAKKQIQKLNMSTKLSLQH